MISQEIEVQITATKYNFTSVVLARVLKMYLTNVGQKVEEWELLVEV